MDIDTVTPVYFCLVFYVVAMLVVTTIANRQNAKMELEGGDDAAVSTHFLGGKDFGVVILTLTTLASVFSGYTVVGVPIEAGKVGYTSFRWIGIVIVVGLSMAIVNPRLRRLSIFRNYESPGDFIMDRYDSIKVKFGATMCMCIPQLLYLGVQFHALVSLIMNTTKATGPNDMGGFVAWTVISIFLLLFFEVIGGMRSVAYTDSVQSAIMVFVFIAIPCTILADYGGFSGQIAEGNGFCEAKVMPPNSTEFVQKPGYGCLNWEDGKISVGKKVAENVFLRTPSTISNVNTLMFWISGLAFAIHPHIIQRVLSAKADHNLKFVARTIYASPWFAFPGMILLGLTATARKMTYAVGNQGKPAFFAFLNEWLANDSIWKNFLGYMIILAAVAGIMSTADSSLIGVSNTVSVDLYRGWYNKKATGKQTIYFGKAVSLITACISGGIAIYLHAEQHRTKKSAVLSYGNLLTFQNGILWQGLPAFVFGLWTSISKDAIFAGMVSGMVVAMTLMIYQSVANVDPGVDKLWYMAHPDYLVLDQAVDPLVGAAVNVIVCLVMFSIEGGDKPRSVSAKEESLLGGTGGKFGGLTYKKILSYMNGMVEPLTYKHGMYFLLNIVFLFGSFMPRLDHVSPDVLGKFPGRVALNGSLNKLILGIPSWIFWQLIMLGIATIFGIVGMGEWQTGGEEAAGAQDDDDVGYELMNENKKGSVNNAKV